MKRTDNYQISRDRAQAFFLNFDQQKPIGAWHLEADEAHIFLTFLGENYRISRKTGQIYRCWDDQEAGFQEVLSIFDLLCHPGDQKVPAFRYAPVNSLKGAGPLGVGTDFHRSAAAEFARKPDAFSLACKAMGAEPVDMGDLGFRFRVFGELYVILKFYWADEDFPASITLLWDENFLRYVHYETVFYIAGALLTAIREKMDAYT